MSAQLIDTLMEKIHVLTTENKRLTNENQKQKETIERLGCTLTQGGSARLAGKDHGAACADACICGADRMVGLLRGQAGSEPLG